MENRFLTADDYVNKNNNVINLYEDLWQEDSTALMLAPREVDKTAKAIDIAKSLTSQGKKVFYLTTQRIAKSNLTKLAGNNLFVHTPEFASDENDKTDYADIVIADLQEAIATTDARIFIIDSLSRIAALSFGKNASANYIMKRLVALQVRHKISLPVLAHDTTRAANRSLINLADCQIEIPKPNPEEEAKPETPIQSQPKEPPLYTLEKGNIEDMRQELIKSLDEGYMVIDENGQHMKFRDWRGRQDYLSSQLFYDWLDKTSGRQSDY